MEARKNDHIELAFSSQAAGAEIDRRFDYEPMTGSHRQGEIQPFTFLGKTLKVPIWVSSMTGGTALARTINTNLARACREFGMGMGLGSCRILLANDLYLPDFDMRPVIGDECRRAAAHELVGRHGRQRRARIDVWQHRHGD